MESTSKFADFNNDRNIMEMISKLEKELTEKTGRKIVLVAYNG